MEKTPIFSLVFPTYNEKGNIKILISDALRVFSGFETEVIVVDDGSTDGTLSEIEELQRAMPNIILVKRDKLGGIGSALIAGYNTARGRYIVSSDSDLSFPVEDIRKIADALLTGDYDLVLGCRYIKGSLYEAPNLKILEKKIISKIGNVFLRLATGLPIHDFSANCRGMKRGSWQKLSLQSRNNFMLFEMIWKSSKMGFVITEVPIRFLNRKSGVSKLNLHKELIIFVKHFLKL